MFHTAQPRKPRRGKSELLVPLRMVSNKSPLAVARWHYPEGNVLENLLTEQANPASASIDTLPTLEVLRIINDEDRKVAEAVEREIPSIAKAVEAVVAVFKRGGRLFYIGAGTSGRLGVLDASECPPTFGVPVEKVQGIIAGGEPALRYATEGSEDDPEAGIRDLLEHGFTANDVLAGIAASGRTPYVLGALAKARSMGAVTIGISCTPDSALARAAEIAITPVTGPEVLAGSTRLKAGTATKMVLNLLTTGTFIRLGYVYRNLMVNVQPNNEKLLDRARRIVTQAAGVSIDRAAELLAAAGNDVRVAILMAKTGAGRQQAERRLAQSGGSVGKALHG
jgi:N-acetylmuramic acid 6-phosphate etherase